LASSSFHASSNIPSSTFTFPLPFDFDRVGSASLTFGVALVVWRDGSLPRDVDGPAAGTANRAGRRPTYSAALCQLKE
jgi:hypothetical protein